MRLHFAKQGVSWLHPARTTACCFLSLWCFLSFLCPPHCPWALFTLPDSDSWRLKHFKGQHFCWALLGLFTSVGHTCIVPENKQFLHLLYLWSTEESAFHPICCDNCPNSTVTCQEVPQTLLTLLTGTPCFHLFGQTLLTPLLAPHKMLLCLSLHPPVWAVWSSSFCKLFRGYTDWKKSLT